jgi:hypothetical protein
VDAGRRAGGVAAPHPVEDPIELVGGDRRAAVDHVEHGTTARGPLDPPAGRGVLDGVRHPICDHHAQLVGLGGRDRVLGHAVAQREPALRATAHRAAGCNLR